MNSGNHGKNMPYYTLKNNETGDTEDIVCTYEEMQLHLKENPHLHQVLAAPRIVSGIRDVRSRTPDGFKDVLKKVKKGSGKNNTIDA
jgi:hypothetical protein